MNETTVTLQELLRMFTTTLGSAAVIAAVSVLFFSSERRRRLHRENKTAHRFLVMVLFGLLSIYASASAVEIDGLLCNCRNLPPLYAGMVGGPIAGIGSALIGGGFRLCYGGKDAALPCALACLFSGVLGSAIHLIFRRKIRFHPLTGMIAAVIVEACHQAICAAFGLFELTRQLFLPEMLASALGMMFCLYIYKHVAKAPLENEEA